MPIEQITTYNQNVLTPAFAAERAVTLAKRFQANSTFTKGQLLGAATSSVNEVQTLTITGTPTGGTFKLRFRGQKTVAIAHNANAATVQAALEALIPIGTGNVTCGGGGLPGTPVTITFTGALAGNPQNVIEFPAEDNLLTGGTSPNGAITVTTKGVAAGAMKAWNGALLANPTTGPAVTTITGGTLPVGLYLAQMAWVTPAGETLPSLAVGVVVPDSTNDGIRFPAINAAGTPDEATAIRYYLNGAMVAEVAVTSPGSGGTVAQTDILALPTTGVVPKAPQAINTAFVASDGSHILRGICLEDFKTDARGYMAVGSESSMEHGQMIAEGSMFIEGYFRVGDLTGVNSTNGPQMDRFGRFVSGAWNDSTGIFRLGAL